MFEPLPSRTPIPTPAGVAATPLRSGRLPHELEHEFAEMQAAAPMRSPAPGLLLAALLFHAVLIAEQIMLRLPAHIYLLRGLPVTAVLGALLFAPPALRQRARGCAALAVALPLMVGALIAGISFARGGQLLLLQSAVAALMVLAGSLFHLSRRWVFASTMAALVVDTASLLGGPALHSAGAAVVVESCWAPLFGAALAGLLATARQNEARRDFLLLRHAAFAGADGAASGEAQKLHLDPQTGVANRLAFDMRFRAAWDQAAARRHSVALLFFAIDHFAEQKRDLGPRFAELLQGQIAACLRDGLRRSDDMVARFDNQHFVVMLPGVGADGATQIAERLRGCVEELGVFAGQTRHRVTVTVGAASLRAKRAIPRDRLVEGAIQALDQGRATGTNLVCVEGRGCIPAMS